LNAVAVVGVGRGGVEMGVDGAASRIVVVVVVVVIVDQQMSINKDTSCIACESRDVDSTYSCMCKEYDKV
jgi:hypothetical protein